MDAKFKAAVEAVKNGLSVTKASKEFCVPYTTLYEYIKANINSCIMPPSGRLLYDNEENLLKESIIKRATIGKPMTLLEIAELANDIIINFPRPRPRQISKKPSLHFATKFVRRHQDLSLRTPSPLNKASCGVKKESIDKWFDFMEGWLKANSYWETYSNSPQRIFNVDESGINSATQKVKVVGMKGQRHVYQQQIGNAKQNYSVVVTVNANGDHLKPLLVIQGERISNELAQSVPPNVDYILSKESSITNDTFLEYLKVNFLPGARAINPEGPLFLWMDNFSGHISIEISEYCEANEIILMGLHPHATFAAQPLDVSFFHPFKKDISDEVKHRGVLKKTNVCSIVGTVFEKNDYTDTIISGFRTCGLFPFNKNAITEDKLIIHNRLDNRKKKPQVQKIIPKTIDDNNLKEYYESIFKPETKNPDNVLSYCAENVHFETPSIAIHEPTLNLNQTEKSEMVLNEEESVTLKEQNNDDQYEPGYVRTEGIPIDQHWQTTSNSLLNEDELVYYVGLDENGTPCVLSAEDIIDFSDVNITIEDNYADELYNVLANGAEDANEDVTMASVPIQIYEPRNEPTMNMDQTENSEMVLDEELVTFKEQNRGQHEQDYSQQKMMNCHDIMETFSFTQTYDANATFDFKGKDQKTSNTESGKQGRPWMSLIDSNALTFEDLYTKIVSTLYLLNSSSAVTISTDGDNGISDLGDDCELLVDDQTNGSSVDKTNFTKTLTSESGAFMFQQQPKPLQFNSLKTFKVAARKYALEEFSNVVGRPLLKCLDQNSFEVETTSDFVIKKLYETFKDPTLEQILDPYKKTNQFREDNTIYSSESARNRMKQPTLNQQQKALEVLTRKRQREELQQQRIEEEAAEKRRKLDIKKEIKKQKEQEQEQVKAQKRLQKELEKNEKKMQIEEEKKQKKILKENKKKEKQAQFKAQKRNKIARKKRDQSAEENKENSNKENV